MTIVYVSSDHQYVLITEGINELTIEVYSGAIAEFWRCACVHTVINS